MSKSDTLEYDVLRVVFNGIASTMGISATAGTTTLWVGLHTADPGDASSTANEGGYAQYERSSVDRSSAASVGWAVTSASGAGAAGVSPLGNVDFPQETATTTGTFTYGSVWTSSNVGSSGCLYNGTISPTINFGQNVTPRLTTGSSITED
jgi:hypothetical protein